MKDRKMKNFTDFDLNPALQKSLQYMKYKEPTPIQAQAIPIALKGRDIMGTAQTGTGKTAAFAIPLIERLMSNDESTAIVLTPTRELAKQIMEIMYQLIGPHGHIKTAFLIGGESIGKQCATLRKKPRLIVGTPGRINDHLKRRTLNLDYTDFLVLDETDRMLDMGFSIQIDEIVRHLPEQRQTLMFSATLPKNILKLSEQYLTNPERIAVGSTSTPAKNIKQEVIRLNQDQKYDELLHQLENRKGSVVVFVKTKFGTERLAKRLNGDEQKADAIHGDLKQSRRQKVINDFRDMRFRILVATDVAARGLDIPHIRHVVNFDLPQVPEDYIHRIGRTARAGTEGEAICFVSPQEGRMWHAIEMLIDPDKRSQSGEPHYKNERKSPGKSKRPFGKKRFENKFEGKKKTYTSKKPYAGKRDVRPSEDRGGYNKRPDDKKIEGKKTYTKKPYVSKSDDRKSNGSSGKPFNSKKKFSNNGNRPQSRKDSYQKRRKAA